jgi:stage II sporulation protein M
MRRELAVAAAILAIGALSGWLTVHHMVPAVGVPAVSPSNTTGPTPLEQPAPLFAKIALRNLTVFGLLLSGVFTLGITSAAVLGYNGVALGGLMATVLQSGMPPATLAVLLLPHGLLELAAFVVAGAVGLRGWTIGREAMRSGSFEPGGSLPHLRRLIAIGVTAVLTAALIESTVTRHLLVGSLAAQ